MCNVSKNVSINTYQILKNYVRTNNICSAILMRLATEKSDLSKR